MPLKRYADFSGRSRRMEYWMFTLGIVIVYAVFLIIVGAIVGTSVVGARGNGATGLFAIMGTLGIFAVIFGVLWLALLIPVLAVQVRRLHDTNRSGWWIMLWVAPLLLSFVTMGVAISTRDPQGFLVINGVLGLVRLVCAIVLLVFFCLPGTTGPNNYGADPMDPSAQNLGDVFS